MVVTFIKKDWTDQIVDRLARTVSRTSVTKTTSNIYGDETLTDGTPANISGVFLKKADKWMFDKQGKVEGGDAYLQVKAAVTVNVDDKITVNSETYRISDVLIVYSDSSNSTALYKYCNLFRLS